MSPRNGEAQNSEDSKAAKIKLALEKMKEAKVISFRIFPKFHFFSRTSKKSLRFSEIKPAFSDHQNVREVFRRGWRAPSNADRRKVDCR